jgi:tetratricopeptide (TPR) repeat protein
MLSASLSRGASFITNYRREEARNAIRQIKPDATLDEAGARLLSAREGIKIVLTGSIERAGSGYSITASAIDPAVNTRLVSVTERAATKDDVLSTVASLASEIREGLGDETPESARLSAAETVTAASIEALQSYTKGQDLLISSKYDESIPFYRRAIELDPKFGRAYASLAVSANSLGRRDEAEALYKQAFALMDRMTEREKYRTYGTYYLTIAGNYEQAIDNYSTLLKLYPADRAARTNLAYAYFSTLNFARALEENRRAMDIYQGSYKLWSNHALYAMYASDFKTAETEAARVLEQSPTAYRAHLPRAMAALSRSDLPAARQAYSQMAAVDKPGASLATMGLADVLMHERAFPAAADVLRKGIDADDEAKYPSAAAGKGVALAEALEAQGQGKAAAAAIERALKTSRGLPTLVGAARMDVRLGNIAAAQDLVAELDKRLQPQPRSYAKIIEGEIAARGRKPAEAIEAFGAAVKLADLWLARFALGVAYVQADHWAEGLRELEACEKRRGEATALFLDDVPTFRYLTPLPYWLARAQEGLGQTPAAAENYKKFLALAPAASRDPLVLDARRRLQLL